MSSSAKVSKLFAKYLLVVEVELCFVIDLKKGATNRKDMWYAIRYLDSQSFSDITVYHSSTHQEV